MAGPVGGVGAVDPGATIINAKNIDVMPPLGGAGVVDPGAPTMNVNERRLRAPCEVPELEIRERPPSTVRNVDSDPPGRCRRCRSESVHHQR
jgi:hypothetical protein